MGLVGWTVAGLGKTHDVGTGADPCGVGGRGPGGGRGGRTDDRTGSAGLRGSAVQPARRRLDARERHLTRENVC